MTIIVTGSTGKIGSSILNNLTKLNQKVIGLSRKEIKSKLNFKNFSGDFNDESFLDKYINKDDIVIHTAAQTSSSNKKLLFNGNEKITKKIVEVCEKKNIKMFIFFSTDLAINPVGNYGKSKENCEKLIIKSRLKNWVIYRLHPFIYDYTADEKTNIGKILQKVKDNKIIILPSNGDFVISPILEQDLNQIVNKTLKSKSSFKKIYEVHGLSTTLKDLIFNYKKKINVSNTRIISIPFFMIICACKIFMLMGFNLQLFETLLKLKSNKKKHCASIFKTLGLKILNKNFS